MVEGVVVIVAVAVTLAVHLVVLHVVADHVMQAETVVRRYKVDRAEWPGCSINYVSRTREPSG